MINLTNSSVTRFANCIMATGLDGTFTNDNRVSLQAQWDLAATQNKALIICEPGEYKLTCTGSGDTRACLRPTDTSKRYELWIGPGVTLKMANEQVSDAVAIGTLFCIANHAAGGYIGWPYGAPTVRAQGGTLDGNTAGQTGWTLASGESDTKYKQGGGHGCIWGRDSLAGGGSHHWCIDNLKINDWYGNAIGWSADMPQQLVRHTHCYDIHFTRLLIDRCGEGPLWAGLYQSSMKHCTNIARTGINVGDFFEPSLSLDCDAVDLAAVVAEGNGTFVGGGSVCDAYASDMMRIQNIYGRGVNTIVQCHGNLSVGLPTENESVEVIVDGITAEDCGSIVMQWGQKGNITVRNVTVKNMRTGATAPVLTGLGPTIAGQFSLLMENVRLENCTAIGCDGGGTYTFRNVKASCLSGWIGHFLGSSVNTNPVINMNNVTATGYPIGLLFSGTSAPTGRWTNVDFSGCTLPKLMQDTATLGGVEIPDGIVGKTPALVYIGQPLGQDQQPIQGCRAISGCWTNGATYTTIPAGHKYQLLRVVPGGQPATLSPSSTLKLSGNTSVSITSPDVIELMYDTLNGYWREVSRSINH